MNRILEEVRSDLVMILWSCVVPLIASPLVVGRDGFLLLFLWMERGRCEKFLGLIMPSVHPEDKNITSLFRMWRTCSTRSHGAVSPAIPVLKVSPNKPGVLESQLNVSRPPRRQGFTAQDPPSSVLQK